jgi:hypothetical protein
VGESAVSCEVGWPGGACESRAGSWPTVAGFNSTIHSLSAQRLTWATATATVILVPRRMLRQVGRGAGGNGRLEEADGEAGGQGGGGPQHWHWGCSYCYCYCS